MVQNEAEENSWAITQVLRGHAVADQVGFQLDSLVCTYTDFRLEQNVACVVSSGKEP